MFKEARITKLALVSEVMFARNFGYIEVVEWADITIFTKAFGVSRAKGYCWFSFRAKRNREEMRSIGNSKVWRLCVLGVLVTGIVVCIILWVLH